MSLVATLERYNYGIFIQSEYNLAVSVRSSRSSLNIIIILLYVFYVYWNM